MKAINVGGNTYILGNRKREKYCCYYWWQLLPQNKLTTLSIDIQCRNKCNRIRSYPVYPVAATHYWAWFNSNPWSQPIMKSRNIALYLLHITLRQNRQIVFVENCTLCFLGGEACRYCFCTFLTLFRCSFARTKNGQNIRRLENVADSRTLQPICRLLVEYRSISLQQWTALLLIPNRTNSALTIEG